MCVGLWAWLATERSASVWLDVRASDASHAGFERLADMPLSAAVAPGGLAFAALPDGSLNLATGRFSGRLVRWLVGWFSSWLRE